MRHPRGGNQRSTRRPEDEAVRVAIVTESLLPRGDDASVDVRRVGEELRALGHAPLVLCARTAPGHGAGFPVPVRAVPARALRGALVTAAPDVVHVTSPFGLGARALREAHTLGIPSVAVHETDLSAYLANRAGALGAGASGAAWRWVRRVLSLADRTLAPSAAAREDLVRHGVPRVGVWGRGVDTALFHPGRRTGEPSASLRRSLLADDEVLVGHVGRLAPGSGLGRLEEVVRVPGVRLVVAGDGPSRVEVALRLAEAAADVRGRPNRPPVLLGAASPEALATVHGALDVFVHPGTRDPFGRAVQEATASGVAVVAPSRGGAAALVDHGRTGLLVDPDRLGGYAAAVAALTADSALRARMGRAGRARAERWTWVELTDELVGHYADVRARSSAAA
jgi:phosphatidylinositol alpha 1,6-mannosyltransferase